LYLTGKTEQARDALLNATRTKPDFDQGWYNLGNVLYALKSVHESMQAYQKAVELNPENQIARENLQILENEVSH